MIVSLIFGGIAGFFAPQLQPHVEKYAKTYVNDDEESGSGRMFAITFGVALLVASIALNLVGHGGSAFWMVIGGLVGLCSKEVLAAFENLRNKRSGSKDADADTAEN